MHGKNPEAVIRDRLASVSDKLQADLDELGKLEAKTGRYKTVRAMLQGSDSETNGLGRVVISVRSDYRDDYDQSRRGPKERSVEFDALTEEERAFLDRMLARQEALVLAEIRKIDGKWQGIVPDT